MKQMEEFAKSFMAEAGENALAGYGKGKIERKFDDHLVTRVELSLEELFKTRLSDIFPSHRLFQRNREEVYYTHGQSRHLWSFDSLDGVANYQAGVPIWASTLAFFDNFWPIFGCCSLPVTGDLFFGKTGTGAYLNDTPIRVSLQDTLNDESRLFTFSSFHRHYQTTFPGKTGNMGCTAAHLCYVAMGRAEAAVITNESYQDLAAVAIIVEAAGGKIYKTDGGEFSINEYLSGDKIDSHFIVTTPTLFPQVRDCLQLAD